MDIIEEKLREYATYEPKASKLVVAPIDRIFKNHPVKRLSNGMNTRVFKFKDYPWVVKEGRWDIEVNLFGDTTIEIPPMPMEKLLNLFELYFLPKKKEIARQYKLYLTFIEYFGFFRTAEDYYHPRLDKINERQKKIRDSLEKYKEKVEKYYKFKVSERFEEILDEDVRYYNFLPKEYLLYGKSISKENEQKFTYYIFQEFVKGKLLHDIPNNQMPIMVEKQLALLTFLILLLNMEEGLLPDTRLRYVVAQAYDWLTKTDNIIVSEQGAKFIDTRWLWETDSTLIKKGLFITNMTTNQAKKYLNYYLDRIG